VYSHIKDTIKNIPTHGQLYFIPTSLNLKNSRINDIADRLSANKNSVITIACLLAAIENENEFDYILVDCPPSSNIIIQGRAIALCMLTLYAVKNYNFSPEK
jgi:cellulose biosynthesis protein BcsQ